jgi:UDP-N-acetylmuramoylalanine--D-glutamate ligase
MKLPGEHNRANAAMAMAALTAAFAGVSEDVFKTALRSYAGLTHRLEFVADKDGVRYFNDSKSTTPQATLTALAALTGEPNTAAGNVHLIAGGYDKKISLREISTLAPKLAGLYAVGQTGPAIVSESQGAAINCETLAKALVEIKQRVRPGDVVLLSPGCASWGQFENFEQRGELFKRLVGEL